MRRIPFILFFLLFSFLTGNGQNITTVSCPASLCAGKEVNVSFTTSALFGAANIFTAQLSNSSGSFTTPVNIGFLEDVTSGTINAIIPAGTASGTGYRIRVVTSSPATTPSLNNGANITINLSTSPNVSISTPAVLENFCQNSSISFTATPAAGGASPSYQWFINNTPVPSSNSTTFSNSSWAGSSKVFCVMTSSDACALPASAASNVISLNPDNPGSNSWQEKAGMISSTAQKLPAKRNGAFGFNIGSKGYLGGGNYDDIITLSDFWEFDPATNAWTQRADFGGGSRVYAVAFSIAGNGFAGTGQDINDVVKNDFWKYDPASNSWMPMPDYPGVPVTKATGFSLLSKGYIGTGIAADSSIMADFYEFNPATNTWNPRAALPFARYEAYGFSIGSKGYIGAGNLGNTLDNNMYMYDPSNNTWATSATFPGSAKTGITAVTLGSKAYAIGGYNKQGQTITYYGAIYEFNGSGWATKLAFPGTVRTQATGFGIGTMVYFGQGASAGGVNNVDMWQFNSGTNTWASLYTASPDSNARRGAVGFSIGDKGYIFGGKTGTTVSVYKKDLWEFNAATNSWSQKASLPVAGIAREQAVAFSIGNKGYMGTGGYADLTSVLNDFWEYDPSLNNWTQKASFGGTARYAAVGFSIGSKGYIGTGRHSTNTRFRSFFEYDPASNTWTAKDSSGIPAGLSSAVGFSIDTKGYIATGINASGTRLNTLYEFDPANGANGTWTAKTAMGGVGRIYAVGFGVNGRGYVGTGENASSQPLSDLWEYDPSSGVGGTWTQKQNVPGGTRTLGSSFSIGFKGYIGLGFVNGGTQVSDLWEYSPVNTRINTDSVRNYSLCAGTSTTLHFSIGCYPFQAGNSFTAQLSDSGGRFLNPQTIGSLSATTGGSMTVSIPGGTVSGTNYRIRVIGSSPNTVGTVIPNPIIIAPAISVTTQPSTGTQILCLNATVPQLSVASSGSNLSYQWYSNSANNSSTGTSISGATLANFTPPSIDTGTRYYYCKITSACGSTATSNVSGAYIIRSNGSWVGTTTEWENAANWCGGIPTATTDVVIPAGTTISPVISTAPARCRNVTISGGSITVNSQMLSVSGTITGAIDATNGGIELMETSSSFLKSSSFTQKTIKNLKISKGGISFGTLIPNDTLKISGILSFGKGGCNFSISSGSLLVIKSNVNSTASIADMTSDGTNTGVYTGNQITGNVMIERYLANQSRAWQFLAVPAKGQTIKNAWQEGQTAMGNLKPGYGTIITGNIANPTLQGFDTFSFAPSMKLFDSATQSYLGISSTNNLIDNPKGYMLFVRGDRTAKPTNSFSTPTTLRITGNIYQPTNPPPVVNVARGKFMSAGNPYASAIKMSNITRTGGVRDAYYIWDPRLTNSTYSAYGLGGFRTLIPFGTGYVAVPAENTSGVSYYESGNTNVQIQSGQAFFVQSDSATGPGTLTFAEKCKAGGSASIFRPTRVPDVLRINLLTPMNNDNILLDGVISLFDAGYNNRIDINDIPKMLPGGTENISINSGGHFLVAEQRKLPNPSDTIHLAIKNLRQRHYSLEFSGQIFSPYAITPVLVDRYLGTFTEIDKTGITSVDFLVTADPAASAPNRFYIIFKPEKYPMEITYVDKR